MLALVIDSILLFVCSIPIVMQYRILPIEGTPYWLFGLLFLMLISYCFISLYPKYLGKLQTYLSGMKTALMIVALCITLGGSLITAMFDRAKIAPIYGVHDIILQQEAAMRYLIVGKNPYKETYFGTAVEDWHYGELGKDAINPALYHFVMPPWYLLFPFLFYYTSIPILGFFDGRMALLFTMVMLLVSLWFWYRDKSIARTAIILTALSPSVVPYFIEGRSDVFALAWLMCAMLFLGAKRYALSGLFFALAMLSKQTIWFMFPFYFIYLWQEVARNRKIFWQVLSIVSVVGILFVAPFVLWDARAFFESVVLYLTGNTSTSYPVSGYGLGMMLYEFGVIGDIHAYYPFVVWQLIIAIPLFVALARWLWNKPTQSKLMISYAIFLSVYWYLSRYFNNSHLGYLSMLFAIGGLKLVDETHT